MEGRMVAMDSVDKERYSKVRSYFKWAYTIVLAFSVGMVTRNVWYALIAFSITGLVVVFKVEEGDNG